MSVPGSHSNVTSSAVVPGCAGRQPRRQAAAAGGREKRGRAAAEYTKFERARRRSPASRDTAPTRAPSEIEILLDVARVLVRVDAEVAEMALLPAERDVQVQPERHAGLGWLPAPAARPPRRRPASTPRKADSWKRSSCRPRSDRARRRQGCRASPYYTDDRSDLLT